MVKKNKKMSHSQFVSIVGSNSTFSGDIECEGSIRIDGMQEGNIKATGNVLIGPQGVVKGNVEGLNVQVAGTIYGNVRAQEILRILSTAKLFGDIEVRSFVADEGAIFQGKCKMLGENEAQASDEANLKPATSL